MSRRAVEVAAIELAVRYAVINGYQPTDRTAIGLVLVGLAIGSGLGEAASEAIAEDYRAQHPGAADALDGWTALLDEAAR
jgi:hypothetical protein